MSDHRNSLDYQAIQDFRAARQQADLERIKAALVGKSTELMSYEDVREKLRLQETNQRRLKEIPLDAIVGSVGRSTDFTRSFFPRMESNEQRWTRVRMQAESMDGLPPIEAYQLGEVYFVIDGNHRVSVARSLGSSTIEAYVTKVQTKLPISQDFNPDQLIIMERYSNFLESTGLGDACSDIDLQMSEAGNYRVLENQIRLHQAWMEEKISYQDAAIDWYKTVYCPVIQIIRERGMLRDFPQRTETDLYVWIEVHRQDLAERLGWKMEPDVAAADLIIQHGQKPKKLLQRAGQALTDMITPESLESGPMPGEWRRIMLATHQEDNLFRNILVAINGDIDGWNALDQAVRFAQSENSRVHGLHIQGGEYVLEAGRKEEIQHKFNTRCQEADIAAEISFETGNIASTINDRARWMDLVVLSLAHPPGPQPLNRLSSGFSQLLRRCPCPVLAVPMGAKAVHRVLLAYDDSLSSKEALYIATHLGKRWKSPLTVISVTPKDEAKDILNYPREYLQEAKVHAEYLERTGSPASQILQTASDKQSDLILMGTYGYSPIKAVALGSTVDEILRAFDHSTMICR